MSEHFLYETLDILRDAKVNLDLPEIIETGLSKNIILREYQIERRIKQMKVIFLDIDGVLNTTVDNTKIHIRDRGLFLMRIIMSFAYL